MPSDNTPIMAGAITLAALVFLFVMGKAFASVTIK